MNDIIDFLNKNLAVITTLVGTLLGVIITNLNQRGILDKQIKRDEEKEKRAEARETLEIYNGVLKIDGENMLIVYIGGAQVEIDIGIYQDKLRPILYEKYHIMHNDVAKIVSQIDGMIQKCNYNEEITREDHEYLTRNYSLLIKNIKQHIFNFRKINHKD